jgi:hypothetical protein
MAYTSRANVVYVYVVLYRLCAVALLKDQPFGNGEIKFASIDGSAMQPSSSFTPSVPVTTTSIPKCKLF